MQIVMHPKIKTFLLTLMAVLLVAITSLAVRNRFFSVSAPKVNIPLADQQAAINGAGAFYNLDYEESSDVWSERVCTRSTTKGCEIVKSYFAPTIHELVSKHRIKTGCQVKAIHLVEDNGEIRIWQLQVNLDSPWDRLESAAQNVYVEVSLVKGQWLMNRILFNQEIKRFHRFNQEAIDE